ncbi:hypothetical protein C8Q79DRAFT_349833 [Trametes meyenii]|nr:hypothetical protein C8Q79DRAFT_349833 [Trametes meyenii]
MPRFLDTTTGCFIWNTDLHDDRYAILSHTWRPADEGGEQSYGEVCKIQATVAEQLRTHAQPEQPPENARALKILKNMTTIIGRMSTLPKIDLSDIVAGIFEHPFSRAHFLSHSNFREIMKQICEDEETVSSFITLADPEACAKIKRAYKDPEVRTRLFTSFNLFEKIKDICDDVAAHSPILSHPDLSDKIVRACEVARQAGYRLIWIDSCCINKSSSAELSEAINSMYDWYSKADVCYAYLADVSEFDDISEGRDSEFWQSKWHTRGWTLQELIAPKRVVFLSDTWDFIGTKMSMASTLKEVTGVDVAVLTGSAPLDSVSVARRMLWASKRETTRIEDKAYCLLGVFSVHLSPIYGEGSNAFLRLQEEIAKTVPDQTLFAWGPRCTLYADHATCDEGFRLSELPGLLAPKPDDFSSAYGQNATPLSAAEFAQRLGWREEEVPPLHTVFTPQGILVKLVCLDLSIPLPQIVPETCSTPYPLTSLCSDCTREGVAHTLGLLRCGPDWDAGAVFALPLCRMVGSGDLPKAYEEQGLLVTTHIPCNKPSGHTPLRCVIVSQDFFSAVTNIHSPPVLRDVFVRRHPLPSRSWSGWPPYFPFSGNSPLCVAPWCADELRAQGYHLSSALGNLKFSEPKGSTVYVTGTVKLVSDFDHEGGQTGREEITIDISLKGKRFPMFEPERTARYSIKHAFHVPVARPELEQEASHAEDAPRDSSPRQCAVFESPCADGGSSIRAPEWVVFPVSGSGSTQAHAEFVLHADLHAFHTPLNVKCLHIKLVPEYDSEDLDVNMFKVYLEISQPHPYEGKAVPTDADSLNDIVINVETLERLMDPPSDNGPTSATLGSSTQLKSKNDIVHTTSTIPTRLCEATDQSISNPDGGADESLGQRLEALERGLQDLQAQLRTPPTALECSAHDGASQTSVPGFSDI